jgi:hypothetical protein
LRRYTYLELVVNTTAESSSPPIMSLENFRQLMSRIGIAASQMDAAEAYLSQNGIIVLLNNDSSQSYANMRTQVCLDPMWIAGLFKTLITTKHNFIEV